MENCRIAGEFLLARSVVCRSSAALPPSPP
jgi:hypothetical protein